MPLTLPTSTPLIDRRDAVVAGRGARGVRAVPVGVARGVELLVGPDSGAPKSYQRAPISLLLQVDRARRPRLAGLADAVPLGRDRRRRPAAARAARAKLGFSGQMPESTTPTIDALAGAWSGRRTAAATRRRRPSSPRNRGVLIGRQLEDLVLPELDDARACGCSLATSAAVSLAATPLITVSYSATCLPLSILARLSTSARLRLEVLAVGLVVPRTSGRAWRRSPAWWPRCR